MQGVKKRVAEFAERQHGRITVDQIIRLGGSYHDVERWVEQSFLFPVHPRVYAVGHRAPDRVADLWAAVLYAGPGAMLSHVTAAHWRGLLDYPAEVIEVTTPRPHVQSIDGLVRVYARRERERVLYNGLPTTSVADTLLDVATAASVKAVIRALSQLDYQKALDFDQLIAKCVKGRTGGKVLRAALREHDPALAHTNSELERRLLALSKRWRIPKPRFGLWRYGIEMDAYWSECNLVVEVDGYRNHSSLAQVHRDHKNDLVLRSHGLTVFRYDWLQLNGSSDEVEPVRRELTGWIGRADSLRRVA